MIMSHRTHARHYPSTATIRRKALFAAGAIAITALAAACGSSTPASTPATGPSSAPGSSAAAKVTSLSMGIEPWLGYGAWYIAQDKGYFAQNNLKVDIVNFQEDADIDAAYASGKVQVANIATNTLLQLSARDIDLSAVLLEDESMTADAIIAPKDITSVKDLKGKSVAFEQGTTSDVLLNHALQENGMTIADVNVTPMAAANVGSAMLAGKADIGVTYEPYLDTVLKAGDKFHILYSAGEDPGLISDVLVAHPDYAKANPEVVKALVRSWGQAVDFYNAHTDEARAIIAKGVGATPESLSSSFDGVKIYTVAEAKKQLTGPYVTTALPDVLKAAKAAGLVKGDVPELSKLVDSQFVQAAG